MAWIDDRVWCHPKFTDLSRAAFAAWCCGVAYSSGMGTKGVLTPAQQRLVGAGGKVSGELVAAGLWDIHAEGVRIHDWDEHNGKRDQRKEDARIRMRAHRARERSQNSAQNSSQHVRVLKEVKEVTTPISPSGTVGKTCPDCGETYGAGHLESCPRMPVSA